MAGLLLLIAGGIGVGWQYVKFVREVIPMHYGSNPGFGALESMVFPWFVLSGAGVGLWAGSWIWGLAVTVAGTFLSGFMAMLLGKLFGGRKHA